MKKILRYFKNDSSKPSFIRFFYLFNKISGVIFEINISKSIKLFLGKGEF
jgi:hypothetical protein